MKFDRDLLVADPLLSRPASGYSTDSSFQYERIDAFERYTIAKLQAYTYRSPRPPGWLDGALLTSAILFGALIDRRLWESWLAQSYGEVIDLQRLDIIRTKNVINCHRRIWIDCKIMDAGTLQTKRWVADPLTHCLIFNWQNLRKQVPLRERQAHDVVATFLGFEHDEDFRKEWLVDSLVSASEAKWRMRMPSFLVEAASRRGRSVNLPKARWNAMLRRPAGPVHQPRSEVWCGNAPVKFSQLLGESLVRGSASSPALLQKTAEFLENESRAENLPLSEQLIYRWAAARLAVPPGKRSARYLLVPRTVSNRAEALRVLLGDALNAPSVETIDCSKIVSVYNDLAAADPINHNMLSHLQCFFKWFNDKYPELEKLVPINRRLYNKKSNNDSRVFGKLLQTALKAGKIVTPNIRLETARNLKAASLGNDVSLSGQLIYKWASTRITSSSDSRDALKQLSPSTILERGRSIFRCLGEVLNVPNVEALDRDRLAAVYDDLFSIEPPNPKLAAHMQCFQDWLNRHHPQLALNIVMPSAIPGQERSGVNPQILTADEYRASLAWFDRTTYSGAAARVLITLGFRCGLRWSEAVGLSVSDIRIVDRFAEVAVRMNLDRRTKTPAGRRVLPLHLFLEADELGELRNWWAARSCRQQPVISDVRSSEQNYISDDERRLFPTQSLDGIGEFHRWLKREIEGCLRSTTGDPEYNFHSLRHAFGSYLLATLSLPSDVSDCELVPRLDHSLVSHARRECVAAGLWGQGRLGLHAVNAVSAILGHSGSNATLRSYMHLHDWLIGLYVARPAGQRALSNVLVAKLVDLTPEQIASAERHRQQRNGVKMRRGRPRIGSAGRGSVALTPFVDARDEPETPPPLSDIPVNLRAPVWPCWQSLAAFMAAADADERTIALLQPDLAVPFGQQIVVALEKLLAIRTRARKGVARKRQHELPSNERRRAARRLGTVERDRLARLYTGASNVEATERMLLTKVFAEHYDRPRGVLRVPVVLLEEICRSLRIIGCREDEITIVEFQYTATIRVGAGNRTGRGFTWAMLFISAITCVEASTDMRAMSPATKRGTGPRPF